MSPRPKRPAKTTKARSPASKRRAKSAPSRKASAKRTLAKAPATKSKAGTGKPTPRAAAKPVPAAAPARAHCLATDPFGDPCQSSPRPPSRYCTIHSFLDRT